MVGERDHGRPMGHHHHRSPGRQLLDRVGDDLLGERVEVGGGLVQEHPRPVRQHDPCQGEPRSFTGRQGRAVLTDGTVEAAGEIAHALLQGDPAKCLPQGVVISVRCPQAQVVGDRAGHEHRTLREPRHLAAPGVAAHRHPAEPHRPAGGLQQGCHHRQQGRLAATGRSPHDSDPVRRDHGADGTERRHRATHEGHAHLVEDEISTDGRGRLVLCQVVLQQDLGGLEGRHALGRGMELGADASQWPVGLGCQQQDDQRGVEVERAGGEPHPYGDRHQGDGEGGDQLEHGRGCEGDPKRGQRGPAAPVGDLGDPRGLRPGASVRDERGQAPYDVDEMARERGQGRPLLACLVPGGQPHECAEHGDQGKGDQHDHAAQQVLAGHGDDGQRRQHRGEDQGGHVAGQVRLGRGHTASDERGDLPAGGPRRGPGGRQHETSAQRRSDPGRRRCREHVTRPSHEAAEHQDSHHPGAGSRDVTVAQSGEHEAGDEPRLGQHQHASDHARDQDAGQLAAGRRQVRAQPGVEGPHGPAGAEARAGM